MCVDRRQFMKLGGLGALALSLGSGAAEAYETETGETALQDAPAQPTMASRAKPITREEYLQRQETARRYMRDAGLDAIFLTGGASLNYFTGIQWGLSERLFAMVFPAKGDPGYVTPAFEKARALEQIKFGDDVRTWEEHQSPYELVAGILKDRGIATGKVGIEETVRFVFFDGIAKAAPAAHLSSADPVSARCRRVKSTHEIELIRLANEITLKAFENALKSLHDGMTHCELGQKISSAHRSLGA